jgi:hypothetical protein
MMAGFPGVKAPLRYSKGNVKPYIKQRSLKLAYLCVIYALCMQYLCYIPGFNPGITRIKAVHYPY